MEEHVHPLINTWHAIVHKALLETDAKLKQLLSPKSNNNLLSIKITRIFTSNPLKLIIIKSLLKYVCQKKMSTN